MSEYLAPKNEDGSKSKGANFLTSTANAAILVYAALAVIFGLLLAVSFGGAYFNLF